MLKPGHFQPNQDRLPPNWLYWQSHCIWRAESRLICLSTWGHQDTRRLSRSCLHEDSESPWRNDREILGTHGESQNASLSDFAQIKEAKPAYLGCNQGVSGVSGRCRTWPEVAWVVPALLFRCSDRYIWIILDGVPQITSSLVRKTAATFWGSESW